MDTKTSNNATNNHMSKDYEAALETSNAATLVYREAQRAYRAMETGDDEFLAARAVHVAACADFDKAFAKEENHS